MTRPQLLSAALFALVACGSPQPDASLPPAQIHHASASAAADPGSGRAATALVARYFALLSAKDFRGAYRLWGAHGEASGKTLEDFRAGFGAVADLHAAVGAATDSEGAAGSVYITVPVQLSGRRLDGSPLDSRGKVTLRRVNDVPGSTDEQRRWHIQSIDLAL